MEKYTIETAIAALIMARETKKAAEKQEKSAAEFIKAYAGGRDTFQTENYSVVMDRRTRCGLDTAALYRDFPDIKNEYGTVSEYVVITAARKAEELTA